MPRVKGKTPGNPSFVSGSQAAPFELILDVGWLALYCEFRGAPVPGVLSTSRRFQLVQLCRRGLRPESRVDPVAAFLDPAPSRKGGEHVAFHDDRREAAPTRVSCDSFLH